MFVTSSLVDVECAVVDGHVGVESTSDATSSREEGFSFLPGSLCRLNWRPTKDTERKKMAEVFKLRRGSLTVKLTNWGATIISLLVPDAYGESSYP